MSWEVAQQLAVTREVWRQRVAHVSLTRDELRSKVSHINCSIFLLCATIFL